MLVLKDIHDFYTCVWFEKATIYNGTFKTYKHKNKLSRINKTVKFMSHYENVTKFEVSDLKDGLGQNSGWTIEIKFERP